MNTAPYLAAAMLLLMAAGCGGEDKKPVREARVVPVEVITARPAPFTEVYGVTAVARAVREFHLDAEVGGTLLSASVDVGSEVQAGDVLARLDPEPLTLARDTRMAELERARVRASLARKDFERREALSRQGSVADSVLEEAELSLRLAEADLRLAELALKDAERNLANATVTAPAPGEITRRFSEPGSVLAPGAPLFHLARTDRIQLTAGLSERQVVYVSPGVPVTVHFDALPDADFDGKVERVGSVGQPGDAAFPVVVYVDNADGHIRPGMVGRLNIPGRTLADAFAVPAVAVRNSEAGERLYVVDDQKARAMQVTVEAFVDELAIIAEGLVPGSAVIVVGQTRLKGGEKVSVTVADGVQVVAGRQAPAVYGLP
ncbi:MAG: efflux RND transporter periplasmic adaptor subunit [Leptospirillia bacterium]